MKASIFKLTLMIFMTRQFSGMQVQGSEQRGTEE
jgi:hypothetical protein